MALMSRKPTHRRITSRMEEHCIRKRAFRYSESDHADKFSRLLLYVISHGTKLRPNYEQVTCDTVTESNDSVYEHFDTRCYPSPFVQRIIEPVTYFLCYQDSSVSTSRYTLQASPKWRAAGFRILRYNCRYPYYRIYIHNIHCRISVLSWKCRINIQLSHIRTKIQFSPIRTKIHLSPIRTKIQLSPIRIAGAVSETWFALGVQAPNYIFVIREQYQTKPDICTSLILKNIFFSFYHVLLWGNDPYFLLFCL